MLDLGGFPMSAAAGSAKRSREESECLRPERKAKKRESVDDDPDLDLSRYGIDCTPICSSFDLVFPWFRSPGLLRERIQMIGDFSDIKGIISALHQIREKALKDGQKKAEETIKRSILISMKPNSLSFHIPLFFSVLLWINPLLLLGFFPFML